MDGLLFLGCVLLFFILVVVPVIAIAAYNRSKTAYKEIALLHRRVETLEQRVQALTPAAALAERTAVPEQAAVPETVTVPTQTAAPEPEPERTSEPPVNPWGQKHDAAPAASRPREIKPAAAAQPSAFDGAIASLLRWCMQGNPLAKLGILLLFLGLSFLLRYTVEYSLFPLELRLVAAALFAIALLAVGWRLRRRQPVYALILQGGASGVLYLTVFGAFRLWQMLPVTLAFALLALICAASVGLAILQRSLSLAMLASLGGYLAPLLLSTGGGSHVGLFSFYLLLSAGILAISARQHWRELNLLGLFFTFGVGSLWGLNGYRPEFYLSCQLFIVANILLFGVLSVALSLRAQERGKHIIDGVLLFAPPLIGFGMQYGITRHMAYGPALSALGYGGVYLALAWLLLRRRLTLSRPLTLAALAPGGAFATLAIPLALSARWTAMAWALEGLGILWLGVRQRQRGMSSSGTGLLLLGFGSALWSLADGVTPLSLLVIFAVLSLCWLAAAWLWRGLNLQGSRGLLAGGILFWLTALVGASQLALTPDRVSFGVLALLSASVWGWRFAGQRLGWRELEACRWLLWPGMLLMLLVQLAQQQSLLADWPNLAWCLALPTAVALLYRDAEAQPPRISRLLHLSLFWMVQLALMVELYWFIRDLPWGMAAWGYGLAMAAGGLSISLVALAVRRRCWPFRVWPALYACQAMLPLAAVLVCLLALANLQDGVVFGQRYLPLINPLEEGAAFALLGLTIIYRLSRRYFPVPLSTVRPWPLVALMAFGYGWLNGMLLRALAWYGGIVWSSQGLWHSRLVQTSFALFWTLSALVMMLFATRRGSRRIWLYGAALLGVVVAKLMLVDIAGGGGLARAVAFIGVAMLVLIVGYFSPLPPKEGDKK
ncbi:DUF2339 domain-containing protein [Intestinirhabdus alba]|jgi:uncharacterized membrane protein|uniref:DUF2339 domain-containing protein n=1 Tax=Intestinirhabdus alba TaxID=2899544 RepID=A0A6L6IK15_9ENTR|nr:DUF2339 domain-containing protein [Intestinirhabdus alba]MTH46237.1 DUF2339 domain-containing protein [Intestinirhabdus alba]